MASIQKSFIADFETSASPINKVNIGVKIPTFSYRINQREIFRYPTGYKNFKKTHEIVEDEYLVNVPLKSLFDSNAEDIYGFFLYHFIDILKQGININDYAFKFEVNIQDSSGHIISSKEYEGIFYQKSLYSSDYDRRIYEEEYSDYVKTYGPSYNQNNFNLNSEGLISSNDVSVNDPKPQINTEGISNLPEHLNKRVFIINKEMYETFKYAFQTLNQDRNINDNFVLNFIQILVDLSGPIPKLSDEDFMISYTQLQDFLRDTEYRISTEFFDYLKENFDKLFDFPIELEEIETSEIKGILTIESDDELRSQDLDFYSLSAEYVSSNSESTILRYEFNDQSEIDSNSVDFEFNNGEPIITSNVDGPIKIRVKGYDGSVLWEKNYDKDSSELSDLQITVKHKNPRTDPTTTLDGKPKTAKKIRGKVLQTGNKYDLEKLTVIIQAKKDGDDLNRIVASGETDKSGNFSLDFPYGEYIEAQALVSKAPDSPVEVEINEDNGNESISDDFIYLLLSDEELEATVDDDDDHDDCGCHTKSPNTAKRLPDQQDLIESDVYTQDIGGTCLNLTTPNRTLREYNYNAVVRVSDPDVSNYILRKELSTDKIEYKLDASGVKIERGIVDLNNPIKWQEAPDADQNLSLYQAVTVATGHIIHFKSVFKADGYSLGDLVYSLPLAPGQKKQIVVFESSHSLTGAESQTLSQGESLTAELVSDRFITDQLSGGINEDIYGRSKAKTSGMSAGLGASASYGGIGGSLGVAGGFSNSSSSASQNSSRNISQFFGEKLRQSLMQNAESFRQLNSSVVTSVTQGQDYGVTAETIANHNHCHSLTMMYFEVLRHYAIYQEVSHVEECLFVPLLLTHFSTENISKWKEILAPNLLPIPSNTYLKTLSIFGFRRQHPLLKAFDANERIKTNYTRVDFPDGKYSDDPIRDLKGEFTLRVKLERPKTRYDRILSFPRVSRTIEHKEIDPVATAKAWFNPFDWNKTKYNTTTETVYENARIFDAFMQLDADFQNKKPAHSIRVMNFEPINVPTTDDSGNAINITVSGDDFFEGDTINKELWITYSEILGFTSVYKMLDRYFKGALISEWDTIFNNQMLPDIFKNIVESLKITDLGWDLNVVGDYKGGERYMKVRIVNGTYSAPRKDLPDNLKIASSSETVKKLRAASVRLDIERIRINYVTDHFTGILFNGYKGDDILDDQGVELYIPETKRDLTNPRKEDIYLVNELIEHLNSNIEHYNKLLWANLDDDRRYMLLDGFNIQTYTATGTKAAMRSLASVVKNELVTITGNSLVFPVADGYRVNRNSMLVEIDEEVFQEISLIDYYKPLTPMPPYRLSVPTRGVFMEAIQGSCDACEMVKENSSQDWDKFRTEEPTSIQPIVTPTPAITEYSPQYRDFANPLVSIQNAPDAPAPAAGLAGLSELLGKSGSFNDITGLAGNQDNAIRTYLSNQENAKAFAEMSKSLATQQHNTSNAQGISDGIDQARRSGNITREDAQNLTRQHLQQQIDGGESNRETAQFEREQNRPSLSEVASQAANRGQAVEAERTDADGTHESVSINQSENADASANNDLLRFTVRAVPPRSFTRTNGDESTSAVPYAGHFGFDYLRDEYIYPIETVLVDTNSASVNAPMPLVSDIASLKSEYLSGDPSPIQPYGQEYFPSWISMFPPRGISGFNKGSRMHEQGIRISIEVDEIDALDGRNNRIELRPSNSVLTVSPSSISIEDIMRRGTQRTKTLDAANNITRTYWTVENAFTIRSGRALLTEHTPIHIIGVGENIEEEIGRIMMYQNDRIPKAELVMVRVSYNSANVTLSSQYHDILKNQSFNQALIRAEVIEDESFIINDLDPSDPDVSSFIASYPQGANHNANNFLDDLLQLYIKLGNNAPPAGSKRSIIFLTDETATSGGLADATNVSGTYVWGNAVVIFGTNLASTNSFVHEIGHSLSLPHIFSTALSPHLFVRGYTDNYMDYTTRINSNPPPTRLANAHDRLYFFKWQWDIMRGDQSLIDDYA